MIFVRSVNLVYGANATRLASHTIRPMGLILLLACANLFWALMCGVFIIAYWGNGSFLGLRHVFLEAESGHWTVWSGDGARHYKRSHHGTKHNQTRHRHLEGRTLRAKSTTAEIHILNSVTRRVNLCL